MCFVFVEIWFGIANGQISSILTKISAHKIMAGYYLFTFFFIAFEMHGKRKRFYIYIYIKEIVPLARVPKLIRLGGGGRGGAFVYDANT